MTFFSILVIGFLAVLTVIGVVLLVFVAELHKSQKESLAEVNRRLLDIEHLLDMRLEKSEFE